MKPIGFVDSTPMGDYEPNRGIRIGGVDGWVQTTSGTSGTTPRMNFDRFRWVTLPIRVQSSGNRLKKGGFQWVESFKLRWGGLKGWEQPHRGWGGRRNHPLIGEVV